MSDWDSRGFYEDNAAQYLKEEFVLRSLLEKELAHAGVAAIRANKR
jgi:ribosomal protein S3